MTTTTSQRLCAACREPRLGGFPPDVAVCRRCDLPRHEGVDPSLTPELFIAGSKWVYARSMPRNPHEYTVRDLQNADAHRSTCLSHDSFEWFVHHIRTHGVRRRFGKGYYAYLIVAEHEYWTMGYPPEVTTIINRQWADPAKREAEREARRKK